MEGDDWREARRAGNDITPRREPKETPGARKGRRTPGAT
jgi:hypothetical protein